MAYIVMAYIVVAYIGKTHIDMTYIIMAYIGMAYIVMVHRDVPLFGTGKACGHQPVGTGWYQPRSVYGTANWNRTACVWTCV